MVTAVLSVAARPSAGRRVVTSSVLTPYGVRAWNVSVQLTALPRWSTLPLAFLRTTCGSTSASFTWPARRRLVASAFRSDMAGPFG